MERRSPSLVISIIALFIALGGTGYAALHLPRNSVGTTQLKRNAVTSPKVRDGSLGPNDFRPGELAGAAVNTRVPSGKTLIGDYAALGTGGGIIGAQVNFRIPFASRFDAGHVQLILSAHPFTAECPGPRQATTGYLCLYERGQINRAVNSEPIHNFEGDGGADAEGFTLVLEAPDPGRSSSFGTWAATAP